MTNRSGMKRGTQRDAEVRLPTSFNAGGHSRRSASVMAGIAGVKAAVGAIAGACCRLRAAAPEAMARAAVVAAMSFIAVCCGCLQQSKQAIRPTARNSRRSGRSGGCDQQSTTLYEGYGRPQGELRLRGGPLPPPKHIKAGSPYGREWLSS